MEDIFRVSKALVTIEGISPYSQSRMHEDPALEGEGKEDYDIRTWRSHLHVEARDGKKTVVIPAHSIMQAMAAAAKYSKIQIPGQGKATWTAKFLSGIALFENPSLEVDPDTVTHVVINANSDGVRGSGKRVKRRYPVIPSWSTTFEVSILDPIITENVFSDMIRLSGKFIGIGRFRPEKGGTNGRFSVRKLLWEDNRDFDIPLREAA